MKILVVDDERKIADALTQRLQLRGFAAVAAYDGGEALAWVEDDTFQGMILDLRLPDVHGIEVLRRVTRGFPDIKVVILSGHGNEHDFETCMASGAVACFHKPADIGRLIEALIGKDEDDSQDQA